MFNNNNHHHTLPNSRLHHGDLFSICKKILTLGKNLTRRDFEGITGFFWLQQASVNWWPARLSPLALGSQTASHRVCKNWSTMSSQATRFSEVIKENGVHDWNQAAWRHKGSFVNNCTRECKWRQASQGILTSLWRFMKHFWHANPQMQRQMVTNLPFYDFFSLKPIQKAVTL